MVVTSVMRGTFAATRRAHTSLSYQSWATSSSSAPIRELHATASVAATTRVVPSPSRLRHILQKDHKRPAPPPIEKPQDFVAAISKPRRGDMSGLIAALGGEEKASVADIANLTGKALKDAGVPVKERKYILWCADRFRHGQHPALIAYDIKKPKKVRGWGPRVQNGYRIRGVKRPGEK